MVQIVPFTGPLTNTSEHRHTRVHFRDVVDQFHDQNCFTNTSTAEQANFAALRVWRQQVHNFNTSDQDFRFSRLIRKFWRRLVNRATRLRFHGAFFVNWFANNVQDTTQRFFTHWNHDRSACVGYGSTANQTLGRIHRNGTYSVFTKVLRNFEDQFVPVVVALQRVKDLWQVVAELNVDNSANHLCNFTYSFSHNVFLLLRALQRPR